MKIRRHYYIEISGDEQSAKGLLDKSEEIVRDALQDFQYNIDRKIKFDKDNRVDWLIVDGIDEDL